MAGLQSENISINSTRLPEQSTSDKDICVFCLRRATPSASDPHAPLFPFFSLVDCRHYACQPCALVHCDNAGRRIFCPKCHCVSRLAQSGRRRTRSAAAATDADVDRVSIDDGVSSTRSRRTRTGTTPHRSALKGKSGTLKRRASSVQFPANPTTSIVPGDGVSIASSAVAVPSEGDRAGEQHDQRRASSPLTQEAVDALPLDPVEARRRRTREQQQQQQLRSAEAAAKAEKAVGLYAITAAPPPKVAPPPPSASAASGTATNEGFKKAKDRSRSQPVPKLPYTILEPKEEYPVPPPLVLHTVEEEETHAPAATGDKDRDPKPVLPAAAAADAAAAATAEEDVKAEKGASALASASKTSVPPRQREDEVKVAMAASADKSQTTGVLPPPTDPAEELARPHQLLDDCENTEAEERGVVRDLEAHERAALMQRMEEEDTAIRARRGLVLEFDSTPILPQQQQPTLQNQHPHHDNTGSISLVDFSDQVSVTSDDELSQRASGHKSATRSNSTSRRRRRTSVNGASELRPQPHENMAGELDARVEKGGQATAAGTPGDALSSAAKSVAGSGSAENTLSPINAARQGRVSAGEQVDDGGKVIAARAAEAEAEAEAEAKAKEEAEAARAAAEAEAHAEVIRTAEEARALAEGQERARQRQLQREAAEEAAEQKRQQQRQEEEVVRQRQQHEERAAFACQALQDREELAREALEQSEAAVREHYERGADEWLTAALPHELVAQRLVRAAAEHRLQQERQQAQLAAEEGLNRDEVEEAEANAWSWLLSGARVDRVLAATEEGDRVQREYEELRLERLQLQLREDTAELVHEEAHGRASFIEYEAATRSLLRSHHAVQRQALAEGERQQEAEFFKKAAARREAALRQRFQWELDELDVEEVGGRAMLREVEREERRTAHLMFLQALASIRRKEVLAQHAAAVADEPGGSSVLSEAPTMIAAQTHRRVQQRQTDAAFPLMIEEDGDGADAAAADMAGAATPPQLRTPLITAKELAELRAREASYAAELQVALERLREAERRVAEEAAIRAQAEQERQAAHAESQRLVREAEQRAEQRIHEARDAAEQLLQAQLADLRDEAVRRAEHAAVMQALAEEEQRAVLEAKLQAAQRQLDEAQQRAQEEVRRARADAAEMAAADAARAAREAQRRDEEWQERCRAEHLLRLAEQEREKEEAVRRLAEIEARAAEAVRLAREEAARTTAEAQERLGEMERRQQAREAEVQSAAQRVRSARDSLRAFDSSAQSSRYATPFRAVVPGQRRPTSSSSHRAPSLVAVSSAHATHTAGSVAAQASVHTPLQTPPLVPSSSRTSSAMRRQPSAQSPTPHVAARAPAAGTAASFAPSDTTPPRVIISSQHTPLSPAVAPGLGRSGAAVPSSSASAAGATSLAAMDPADIIRAAIRSAVQEIVEAQQRTQTLQDRAEQNVELSERRYHRRQSDRLRAERDVAVIESSYAASEVDESEARHQRRWAWSQQPQQRTRHRQPVRGDERDSRIAASRMSEERLQSARSSRGDYAQEVSESPWTRSSSSPALHLSPAGAPLSTAAPVAAARSVSSNTLPSTSSVYFDNSYRPSAAALGAAHQRYGRNGCDYAAVPQQQQQRLASFAPYSSASRVLFAPRVVHQAREAWAAEDGEFSYAQRMHLGVGAHAYSHVAFQQQQRYATGAPQPLPRQPLLQTVGVTAAVPSVAHAYNEPEPLPPAPAAMEYSPPPRRSTTRAAAEAVPQQQHQPAGADSNVDCGGGIGALPEPSRMCPRCYRTDTTSPCWRCGEMICRHCGLPPGSARKLCCTAHHRAQLREFTRRKTYESGKAATAVGAGKVPSPPPPQQQQQRLRGEQQVQTSFASSTASARTHDAAHFADEPAVRLDVGTSPLTSMSPPPMISPSAYRVPEQRERQQQLPQAQPHYPTGYQAFTMAGPAAPPQQPIYSPGYHPAAAAYPYAYSHPTPQPHQLPPHQLPFYADSERPHTMRPPLDPYVQPFGQPQPYAPFGYSVRAATAALGSATTAADFAAPITVPEAQRQQGTAVVAAEALAAHELSPPASRAAAFSVVAMPHALPAGLTQSPPPPSALPPSQQEEAREVMALRDAEGGAMAEATAPAAAAVNGTPDAQVQRHPPASTRDHEDRANVEAKQPAAAENLTLPNATVAAAVAGSAAADASLPGSAPEKQGGTTTHGDAGSTPDGGAAAAAAVLEEPKTERKKTFPAFFVSLGDGGDAAEPRRPKPPTPRNFVPSQLVPPPPPRKQQRRTLPYGMLLTSQNRNGWQSAHRQHQSRKLSPLHAHEMNCARNSRKSVSPCRGFGAQRRQRHTSPSPYEQAPKVSGARDGPRKTPSHPPSKQPQRPHVHANDTVASMTKSIKSYIKSLSPMVVVDESGAAVVYEDVHKVESNNPWMQQQPQQRPQEWSATATPAAHDIYLRSGGVRGVVAEAERNHPESSHDQSKAGLYYVDAPSQPHDSLSHQHQHQRSSHSDSYYPYFTSSGATSETQSQPPQQQLQQHLYAPPQSHIPAQTSYAAPFVDRRVPTLAELEKRLQQLRIVDEYEAAQYHRRQAQHAHHQQQQRIHVLLHTPGAVAVGGNTGAFVTASSCAARELVQPQQRRHNSATGGHPQQRTVSPPWRTDLNSSPVRPRWDISQPRSPIYHPAPATMTGN
ncbi:conserved hypothetical protein [Leishmania mexicana MHOM/GT/2001/U1103]|uniref:RING-type domain-containing protein n=1 Tax=Leishmania mexicana (strain MHOM/GT/2001/U1103) TaxID=929439 RepID=E9AS66_LEIMU|nr:conserved hypothetical protein [Leishmania mexicana MHOM/GT/2001/U1103]CBZ25787.1 conserved hypothetical protein [Leishmania mexicana MHOM/GT/2001/U1103]